MVRKAEQEESATSAGSLREELEALIVDALLGYQLYDRSQVWKAFLELWNPRKDNSFKEGSRLFHRMGSYHDKIQAAQDEGKVWPWIYTPGVAASTEGIFESAFLLWLGLPPPGESNELPRPVHDYVSTQVRLLTAAIGGATDSAR